ncbi:hypothetical protein SH661x_003150 [Planctomicrobium sp. SH661]|uniref:hypothetical protein n=1 Tax=Planctomicrobium sp. SH661 TaxID=3448124 RepID=UPI003F5C4187
MIPRIQLRRILLTLSIALSGVTAGAGEDQALSITYEGSEEELQLPVEVTYRIWIPGDAKTLRGIIVHQHGCGAEASASGLDFADDLQWQALARKWNCALLGPSYRLAPEQDCWIWADPRSGSRVRFLTALDDFAKESGHPEISTVPWCLWGHSGGGSWVSLMQTIHPERVIAVWCRSGTAFAFWETARIRMPRMSPQVYEVPLMCNPGQHEKEHVTFRKSWFGLSTMFRSYREQGAPVGFAPDPRTNHECGNSREVAIRFFDACMEMRLPDVDSGSQKLNPVDWQAAWLARKNETIAVSAKDFQGDTDSATWLPNAAFAKAWMEYVQTGEVSDDTPPPAPFDVQVTSHSDSLQSRLITWNADADMESGCRQFLVLRNGEVIGQVPETPVGKYGRPLFQTNSYHDTPIRPWPKMEFLDESSSAGEASTYQVISVNGVGLKSDPAGVTQP